MGTARVRGALAALRAGGLLDGKERLTEAGARRGRGRRHRGRWAELGATVDKLCGQSRPVLSPLLTAGVIAPPLRNPAEREQMGFPTAEDRPVPVMAELNLRYTGGAEAALPTAGAALGAGSPATAARPAFPRQYASGSCPEE